MESIARALALYLFLMLIFRLTGKRSIGEISTFDFLLLLIISEAVSNGLVGDDRSVTGALLAALSLLAIDVAISALKRRAPRLERVLEDEPVVLYLDGRLSRERLRKERVSVDDILEAARERYGLTSLDDIRMAVLERRGHISVIPRAADG